MTPPASADDRAARPWRYCWACTRCSATQDYRAGDTLRYYLRTAPSCPVRTAHGRMALELSGSVASRPSS